VRDPDEGWKKIAILVTVMFAIPVVVLAVAFAVHEIGVH
jgi:hypothetical protein